MIAAFSISKGKRPIVFGILVFMIVLILTQCLSYLKYSINETRTKNDVLKEINLVKDRLKASLLSNLAATKTLAFIIENYGVTEDFNQIAKEILNSNKNIDALQLTKKGVITHVYPLKENEKAIGYDILKNPLTNKEAYEAINRRELFFAGPLKLKQGGVGIVGRLPIFKNGQFWGFSVVLVKLPTLLRAAGIDTLQNTRFLYQLSKVNPNTGTEEYFLPNSIQVNRKHSSSIKIHDGEWILYVMPKTDNEYLNIGILSILGLGLSIICGLFAWHVARQPERLDKLVKERTNQLITTQHNYKTTLERVSDAFVSLDKNWCYTYMNKKAGELFNRDPKTIIGKHIWTEFPEAVHLPLYHTYLKAMEEQKDLYLEDYYAPQDFWFENHIYPSNDGITIYFKNVTERKRNEQEILREKQFSESIINSLPGIFYLYTQEGKFLQWNKNFETISGYSAEEISLMHPLDFFEGEEKELLKNKIDLVFETGMAEVEAPFLTKSKEKITYYFNGHITHFDGINYLMGVGIDVTERKRIEKELKESEEKYRYLFNNNPALIMIWDIKSLAILEVNDVALQQYEYTRKEFLSLSILDLHPESEREKMIYFSNEMRAGNISKVRKSWSHLKKNAEVICMDVSSHRIEYNNREAILSLAKDITEQIAAENQLQESYDDVRRLNAHLQTIREEERISIAREIHDELGQQLTALKMDASWLAKKLVKEEKEQHERLSGMISLIDNTVKTVRRISSDLRPGILDDLGLIAALEWQTTEFEKRTGIRCTFICEVSDLHLETNLATGIFRIYQETLTNVMRHAKATLLSTKIDINENHLKLSVLDNGEGFDTLNIKIKKTLGITGMKERALMLGGQLTIESSPKNGACVLLIIEKFHYNS